MLFKRNRERELLAVCDGISLEAEKIPDEAFSSGMLGVGYGIEPSSSSFYSPVSGKIESIADTKHAYTITTDDGIDILVHIGIDTVELGGNGFASFVTERQSVRAGDLIARVDLDAIREKGLPTITAVLIANEEKIEKLSFKFGYVRGGSDRVAAYRIRKE
jgi:glucose-specific phosphotransferase system IIA component